MAWKSWMLSAAALCLVLAACGDDDVTPPTDMGVGTNLNVPDVDLGPPTDAGPRDMGAPVADCDPYTADSCPATEKCAVVIYDNGLPTFRIAFRCVPRTDLRLLGQVCFFNELPGGTVVDGGGVVDLYDQCEQGTFCWDTPDVPGYPSPPRSCQPLCRNEPTFCGENEFCQMLSGDDPASAVVEPTFGVCTPGGCDPVFQTGCVNNDACYLEYTTRSEIIGACLGVDRDAMDGTPFAPGTPCNFTTQCAPGAGCLPTIVDGAFGTGDRACREFCEVAGGGGGFGGGGTDAGVDDAGADVDAGDVDAGADVDAGPADVDAGVDMDAGPPEVDAGPIVVDAGAPDLGTDAGPLRTGLCPTTLGCIAAPSDPDAGMPIRTPTVPGICQ